MLQLSCSQLHRRVEQLPHCVSAILRWDATPEAALLVRLQSLRRLVVDVRVPADLSLLKPLQHLNELSIVSHADLCSLHDVPTLSHLTSLKVTGRTIRGSRPMEVGAAHALHPQPALQRLTLQRVVLTDPHVLSVHALQRLDLLAVGGEMDVSGLANVPTLISLQVSNDTHCVGLSALQEHRALRRRVAYDRQGQPCRDGLPLQGTALLIAAMANTTLRGAKTLVLSGSASVTDLSALASCQNVEVLDLSGCRNLQHIWSILGMAALRELDVSRCVQLRPRPARKRMEGAAAVREYRGAVARALARKSQRTPAQESLLLQAKEQGLLAEMSRPSASSSHKRLRQLLSNSDPSVVRQGMEMLRAVHTPAMIADLSAGISLQQGRVVVSTAAARRHHLRSAQRREWMGLSLLRLAGTLGDVTQLCVTSGAMLDWVALSGLTALRDVVIHEGAGSADFSPLTTLHGLTSLKVGRVWGDGLDLSGLRQLEDLHLRVHPGANLSSLRHLTALQSLSIGAANPSIAVHPSGDEHYLSTLCGMKALTLTHRRLPDLHMLRPLHSLRTLHVHVQGPVSLQPLAALTALRSVHLAVDAVGEGGVDLAPLSNLRQLRTLTLEGVGRVDLTPLSGLRHLHTLKITGSMAPPAVPLMALASIKTLKSLSLSLWLTVDDLRPLLQLPRLTRLQLTGSKGLPSNMPKWMFNAAQIRRHIGWR